MGKISRPRVVTKERLDVSGLPDEVTLALQEIAGAAKEGLLALSVAAGLAVMSEIFEADVARLVGPKGKHNPSGPRSDTAPRPVTWCSVGAGPDAGRALHPPLRGRSGADRGSSDPRDLPFCGLEAVRAGHRLWGAIIRLTALTCRFEIPA